MREKVRRSFVTDLAGFRHLFIRQPEGFVIRATGPDLAYDIEGYRSGSRLKAKDIESIVDGSRYLDHVVTARIFIV